MEFMFKKILIANRGEIALRIIRTCREMDIQTVAVYSTADRESLHVRFADEAVCIGDAPSKDSYLNIPRIISAAEITNADAIHPGYGFLSERAEFSAICHEYGIKFIGPTPAMIQAMGDKSTAKDTMKKAGVPTIPGSDGLLTSIAEGQKLAKEIGYPVIVKATAGGGGKGMRIVNEESEFKKAWDDARREAAASFGNDGLYLEKFIEEPRHIEIQIVGDQYGKVCHLSERDCSIQRRHQKLVEETPSPAVSQELREMMGEAAIKGAKAIKYEGAGTIEFLVDKHSNFYFMEMNTRIQVEHPITEEVTGIDLVKLQILLAAGEKLKIKQDEIRVKGAAMECRINAEDPSNRFMPCPGNIEFCYIPGGKDVRIDTHIYSGYNIPPYYDSLIAKAITKGENRKEVLKKMERVLDEFLIEPIKTTASFCKEVITDPDFQRGKYHTGFLEKFIGKEEE